ncbi:MAG: cell division protein SepF [Thermoanaerobacteraceae bacterium]|nr:cell division protein SepF [Thermoanaerobacteraceae bacterium]
MGKRMVDKILSFLGFEVEEIEDYPDAEMENVAQDWHEVKRNPKSNIISLQSAQRTTKMVLLRPETFEQVQEVADHLKNRRPVIINLEQTEKEVARRIIDFLSGSTYALGGSMQKISAAIFLFVPSNVDVMGQLSEEMTGKGTFDFIKNL